MAKFLILDRDGTINQDKKYVFRIEDLVILPGAMEGLKKFRDAGWKFIVVTNQGGIAKEFYSLKDLHRLHRYLRKKLGENGIAIESFYYCPHHPEVTGFCRCRKPHTKLLKKAAKKFGFSPQECVVVGDKDSDLELGLNFGSKTILIKNNQYENRVRPDFKARDLNQAFTLLKKAKLV